MLPAGFRSVPYISLEKIRGGAYTAWMGRLSEEVRLTVNRLSEEVRLTVNTGESFCSIGG